MQTNWTTNETDRSMLTSEDLLIWCDRLDEQAEYIKQVANQIRTGILYGEPETIQDTKIVEYLWQEMNGNG